jgi:soluble lytic murein transglycosylase-like protein
MPRISRKFWSAAPILALGVAWVSAHAAGPNPNPDGAPNAGRIAEHITLKNGFDLICDHRAAVGAKVRLYMDAAGSNFVEVEAGDIASAETVTLPVPAPTEPAATVQTETIHTGAYAGQPPAKLSDEDLRPMLTKAGATYDIDADLLASVVRQESGGQTHAVSRAGAKGLMQLMPGTAAQLGVADSFAPGENIQGGTAYLDTLLKRYNDNLALALAAYNAGPAAVDRWHGIPPYRETRAYVARVIHEYNRRYKLRLTQLAALAH